MINIETKQICASWYNAKLKYLSYIIQEEGPTEESTANNKQWHLSPIEANMQL